MTRSVQSYYDIAIIGGGMVGASLACMLRRATAGSACRTLLLESAPIRRQQAFQPSFDSRSVAMSFDTADNLDKLGLWTEIADHAQPIKKILVSDQGHFGGVRLNCVDEGVEALGYVIENQILGQVLNHSLEQLDESHQVDVVSPARVSGLKRTEEGFHINFTLGDSEQVSQTNARLVVLAEGGRSGLCESLGIHRRREDYEQTAIVGTVAFTGRHDSTAYERFTRNGPMALLPLAAHEGLSRAGLIWTQASEQVDDVMALGDNLFLEKLQRDFGDQLGTFIRIGERKAYPISLEIAEEQIRTGLVLLGNVAHNLHPVAGQGFNLAFRDALRLARTLGGAIAKGRNPGEFQVLESYLDQTLEDQHRTIAFSHNLTRLFSSDNHALVWLRKFGLLSIDSLPPLKQALSRQAMGRASNTVRF